MEKEIIKIIERNRISSTEVADALDKTGVLAGFSALNEGKHICGKVKYVYVHNESNWSLHEQIQNVEEGIILYVDAVNCSDKAIFGDLVAKYLLLYQRVKAIVVNGMLRDIPNLKKHGYSVWCKGFTPLGCYNKPVSITTDQENIINANRNQIDGGIMVCDDSGCTLINKDIINADTLKKMDLIELQEDIWFYCIDTLKWSTYDTVCLKKYLTNQDVLPPALRERLKEISFSD
ncbi:MAG: RraA family protein [Bacteroidota bacterium]|jgi:4-hydroxy-4-methyl-2-oxoglutarate aldolase